MKERDRLVELLNLDAEVKQMRGWLAAPRTRPSWWDASQLQKELAWLEQRREQIVEALTGGRRIVLDATPAPHGITDFHMSSLT